jgi:hypothetical protein
MVLRAFGLVLLLLFPAAASYATGHSEIARMLVLGTVFAFYFGILARPIAPFAVLIPAVYAAAALTANLTDGVAALILAVAAATGAASSLGYHRALLAVLAAALIGSFEPVAAPVAFERALAMLGGSVYGVLLVVTIGRGLTVDTRAVNSQTALSYSVLLAVLVLLAWFAARAAGLAEAWWLPLTVAALGEPSLDSTPARAVGKLMLALAGTLVLLAMFENGLEAATRALVAVIMLLTFLGAGRHRAWLQGFLLTPVLALLAAGNDQFSIGAYLEPTLVVFAMVSVFTVLGKWMLWTLRPDSGHAAA